MKKIILLALAAASLVAFALPATAMAVEEDIALHVVPKPEGPKTIDGEGEAKLTTSTGTITCEESHGTATFTTSTTGTFEQTFHKCRDPFGAACTSEGQTAETITTETLEFHLVTAVDTVTGATGPGILVTPNATTGRFAHFVCGFFVGTVVVGGNGLVGTITKPKCGESSTEATIEFSSSSQGVQTHKTVASNNAKTGHTPTEYSLTSKMGTSEPVAASEDASGIITLGESAKLECT